MNRKNNEKRTAGERDKNGENKKRNKSSLMLRDDRKNKPVKREEGDYIGAGDILRIKGSVDRTMLIIIIVMLCFGSVMVFSASFAYALASRGDSFYFIKRQLGFAALGVIAMLLVANFIDYRVIKRFTKLYFWINCILLVLVLFMGMSEGDAVRWLLIPGTGIGIQPSEFMKLGIVLMLAKYLSENEDKACNYSKKWYPLQYGLLRPLGILIFVCGLVALEKHFSCIIILFIIGVIVIFVAGGQSKWLIGSGVGFGGAAFLGIMVVPYARKRLDIWLHPENYSTQNDTWQTLQGLYAVGSGGMFGVGLGQSLQKHMFVSQPQNDFIFAIICEELGFVGAVATILMFLVFVWRGIVIANNAPDTFSRLVVIGIVAKVAVQAVLNIAVVTNSIPNTGISLPFFSYGGSSLVILLVEMGIILSISRYSYQKK